MTSNTTRRTSGADRRGKAAAAREAAEKAERRHKVRVRVGVTAVVAVAVGGLVTLGALTGGQTIATPEAVTPTSAASVAAGAGTGMPPWPNAADPSAATRAAGITLAAGEGAAEHYHAHLDIIVNGAPVPVATGIGVDDRAGLMSPLHTHDDTGLIHVEAPTVGTPYYLGQLFREWNVALSATRLGGLSADSGHALTAYVDGKPVSGNPATIKLAEHQEIALVYGPADAKVTVPRTYDFSGV